MLVRRSVQLLALALVVVATLWLGAQVGHRAVGAAYRAVHAEALTGADRGAMELYDYFGRSTRLPEGYVGTVRLGGWGGMVVAATCCGLLYRSLRRLH